MTSLVWILAGLGAWSALAVPVGLLTGRAFRGLDDEHADAGRRDPVAANGR